MSNLSWTRRVLVITGLLLCACEPDQRFSTYCRSDQDCPPNFRCDPMTGLCLCQNDTACAPDEYCAPDGSCKKRMACDSNLDCAEGFFCDTTTGQCIELGNCTQDKQCPLGRICSPLFTCVPGCRQHGDCALGQLCVQNRCESGLCEDKSYCDYGQLCDPQSATCYDTYDDDLAPYCRKCQPAGIGQPYSCGDGPNFCVMTGNDPSLPPFCGVDCSQGQECPNGFSCSRILRAVGGSCKQDEECESQQCHINEGDEVGFCLCVQDSECPQDSCDEFTNRCSVTRRSCTPGSNDCDRPIYCIEGLCLIGRNCTPIEGLRCTDLGL